MRLSTLVLAIGVARWALRHRQQKPNLTPTIARCPAASEGGYRQ